MTKKVTKQFDNAEHYTVEHDLGIRCIVQVYDEHYNNLPADVTLAPGRAHVKLGYYTQEIEWIKSDYRGKVSISVIG